MNLNIVLTSLAAVVDIFTCRCSYKPSNTPTPFQELKCALAEMSLQMWEEICKTIYHHFQMSENLIRRWLDMYFI